jgi:hypothetical protein
MRVGILLAGVLTFSLLSCRRAAAQFIQPDTAIASSQFTSGFDGLAGNTINGSGLPPAFGPGDPHADYASGNHWTTTGGPPTSEFITWGFTTPQTLGTIYIWNHRSTTPTAANAGYDVTLFDLTLFDAATTPLLTLNDVSLVPDTAIAQAFGFGPIANVSSVRFDIEAVQSSPNFTGLAEVRFSATAIPEPTGLAATTAVVVLLLNRRRRTT